MAAAPHQPWCAAPGHGSDELCMSEPLRLLFTEAARHDDEITEAALSLTDAPDDGTTLNLITDGPGGLGGLSLKPGQIRALAMALLAHDALQHGDDVAAAYYSAEARRGQVGV